VQNFRILDLAAEKLNTHPVHQTFSSNPGLGNGGVPDPAIFGISYRSICINVPQYLTYLSTTALSRGANIIKATLPVSSGLAGIVHAAKATLLSKNPGLDDSSIFAVINCAGLSARHFVPQAEAAKLYPVRGQTILVRGEGALARTFTQYTTFSDKSSELAYVIPRPGSGTTILGGSKQAGSWDADVDQELSGRIVERVKKFGLAEELRTGVGGEFEVLSEQVGFRPAREGGPRVEVQDGGQVEGVWVVHAYGHAGAGYQNSVGSAEKVVRLVEGL